MSEYSDLTNVQQAMVMNVLHGKQTHQIADDDDFLMIDTSTKEIIISAKKIEFVQYEHNSEVLTFQCPRYIDGHDILTCNNIAIHYSNNDAPGIYEIEKDYIIQNPNDDNTLLFPWVISSNVTHDIGAVEFAIIFECINDGEIQYSWSTKPCSIISVVKGIRHGNSIAYKYADVLEQWKTQLIAIVQSETNETDEKYFDIDYDGLVSLKPEYRGNPIDTYANAYPYSKSDKGVGVEGSKISELPEKIVIPQNIDGEQVTGFQKGMFCCNRRIKELVIPKNVKAIPKGFLRNAIHLEKVEGTEQIESIDAGGFAWTRIREVRFPNLKTIGNNSFINCSCLRLIDLGNITSIPSSVFSYCENLTTVLGGENVTSVGQASFFITRRLKNLPFLENLTSIGAQAFWSSRVDFEDVYDTLVANGCTFNKNATYKQFNDTDYWSGATFTPCKTELVSTFHQRNPQWAEKTIADYVDENGEACTYGSNGCAFVTLAEIYSAFEKKTLNSPEELVPILESKGLLQYDHRYREPWCEIAKGLGYETEHISTMTQEGLQKVYDALANGALIYKSTMDKTHTDGGHATLGYGINSEGEMLISESSMHCDEVGIYENHKSAWHVYKHGSAKCDVVIVKKV